LKLKNSEKKQSEENDEAGTQKMWWNDEWLAGVNSDLGNYPLLCRVERTWAEVSSSTGFGFH
jgi:hypothetical protein